MHLTKSMIWARMKFAAWSSLKRESELITWEFEVGQVS
jgi:hypothetical protein